MWARTRGLRGGKAQRAGLGSAGGPGRALTRGLRGNWAQRAGLGHSAA